MKRNLKPLTKREENRIRKDRAENNTPFQELAKKYRRNNTTIKKIIDAAPVNNKAPALTKNQRKIAEANAAIMAPNVLDALIKEFVAKVHAAAPNVSAVDVRLHKFDEFHIAVK